MSIVSESAPQAGWGKHLYELESCAMVSPTIGPIKDPEILRCLTKAFQTLAIMCLGDRHHYTETQYLEWLEYDDVDEITGELIVRRDYGNPESDKAAFKTTVTRIKQP